MKNRMPGFMDCSDMRLRYSLARLAISVITPLSQAAAIDSAFQRPYFLARP